MKKELIICIIIIILIIIGNIFTEKYTANSVRSIIENLKELREEIINNFENVNKNETLDKIKTIKEEWKKYYHLLAYFIEHNELEKIETSIIGVESYIEAEEYGEGIAKIDETVFILEHIEKKYKVSLQNVF